MGELFTCRIRRKFSRGLKRKPMAWINCWCLQWQGVHSSGNQARNDWTLFGRVLHLLQACEARKARNWSYPLLQIHPSQVESLGCVHVLISVISVFTCPHKPYDDIWDVSEKK